MLGYLSVLLGHEGRAGMAAVIVRLGHEFDGKALFQHVVADLPAYARPVFIRIQVRTRPYNLT